MMQDQFQTDILRAVRDIRNQLKRTVPEGDIVDDAKEPVILSRYAPPEAPEIGSIIKAVGNPALDALAEAPESEKTVGAMCDDINLKYTAQYIDLLHARKQVGQLTADNAELIEAIKKEVDDREEVYAENELLKAQMETMTKVTYAGEVAILTEQIKRYKEFKRRVRENGGIDYRVKKWILDALSQGDNDD